MSRPMSLVGQHSFCANRKTNRPLPGFSVLLPVGGLQDERSSLLSVVCDKPARVHEWSFAVRLIGKHH